MLKAERRAELRRKSRHAPGGGTRGAQQKLLETRKHYTGSAKVFIRKRRVG
ncbi:hypothetical protein HY480_00640 [Candidatus Uhrbacteria bacterium]|nr:hypothetical protein [Candidatus Uhrbacteria bacterium]